MARDIGSADSTEIVGILYVFPNFSTERMGRKARHSAAAELFKSEILPKGKGVDAKCHISSGEVGGNYRTTCKPPVTLK